MNDQELGGKHRRSVEQQNLSTAARHADGEDTIERTSSNTGGEFRRS